MSGNTSIQTTIHLLTAPLLGARSPMGHPRVVSTIMDALTKSLIAPKNPNYTITMNLTASKLPPSCILAACFAAGVSWAEWCRLLGGDMSIEIRDDYVTWIGTGMYAPITLQTRRQYPKEEVVVDDVEMGDHTVSVVPPTPLPGLEFNRAPSPAMSSSTASSGGALFSDVSRPSSRRSTPAHSRNSSMSSLSSISSTSSSSSQPTVYKYAGGETNVLGGGVKLSAAVAPAPPAPARRTSSRLAEKENNPAQAMKKDVPAKAGRPRAASRATNWRTKA